MITIAIKISEVNTFLIEFQTKKKKKYFTI